MQWLTWIQCVDEDISFVPVYMQLAKLMLQLWWEQMAWKRRAIQLDCLLAIRRRRTLLVQSLHSWMNATFEGLLLANAKFHEDLLEAQVIPLCNQNFKQTSSLLKASLDSVCAAECLLENFWWVLFSILTASTRSSHSHIPSCLIHPLLLWACVACWEFESKR